MRVAELCKNDEILSFGDDVEPITLSDPVVYDTDDVPYNRDANIENYYDAPYDQDRKAYAMNATRYNIVPFKLFKKYSDQQYKLAGIREVITNAEGRADRDITKDNILMMIQTKDAKITNIYGEKVPAVNMYLMS